MYPVLFVLKGFEFYVLSGELRRWRWFIGGRFFDGSFFSRRFFGGRFFRTGRGFVLLAFLLKF
jgi:hypothetical protein